MTSDTTPPAGVPASGRIALPLGWYIDVVPRQDGSPQGFVFTADGKHSASLGFALENGTTSCDEEDVHIPLLVMNALRKYEALE